MINCKTKKKTYITLSDMYLLFICFYLFMLYHNFTMKLNIIKIRLKIG